MLRDIQMLKQEVSPEAGEPAKLEGAARTLIMGASDSADSDYEPLGPTLGALDKVSVEIDSQAIDPDQLFPKLRLCPSLKASGSNGRTKITPSMDLPDGEAPSETLPEFGYFYGAPIFRALRRLQPSKFHPSKIFQ